MKDISEYEYIVVTGGRDYTQKQSLRMELSCFDMKMLFVGDCPTGTDKFALEWAKYWDTPYMYFEADWDNLGKAAGPVRNRLMLKEACLVAGGPENVLLVATPGNRGTANCCETAEELGVRVERVK